MVFKFICRLCAAALFLPMLCCGQSPGQDAQVSMDSPVGRWKTVDDATGKVKSIVTIREESGSLYGTIEQVLDPDVPGPNPLCIKCVGDLKNHPLIGMRFLWGMKKDGDQWDGGQILDPDNGKVYRCYLELEDGGKKLKVRGYIGFALLGRTEYWWRVE